MRSSCFAQRFSVVFAVFVTIFVPLFESVAATPYEADLALKGIHEVAIRASSTNTFEVIPTVRISGTVKRLGHIDARFNVRRNKTWTSYIERAGQRLLDPTDPVLLRGKVAVGGGTPRSGRRVYASGASIINKQLKVTIPGRVTGSRRSRQRIYTIRVLMNGSIRVSARVSSIPSHAFHRGGCGAAVGSPSVAKMVEAHAAHDMAAEDDGGYTVPPIDTDFEAPTGTANDSNGRMSKVVTISTDADPEWYAKFGESSNAVIASIINTAEAIYDKQLGLRFRIVRQHVYTDSSPYKTTDAGNLLNIFTGNSENRSNLGSGNGSLHEEVDIKHLFTGKDLDGSVIGIAYIGTVCAAPALAYGVTQNYMDAADPGIFAHELGHNFGGFHDVSDRTGLMYPSISIPPAERFSNVSVNEISSHLARYGGCISRELVDAPRGGPVDPSPTPEPPVETPDSSPARISLKREWVGTRRDPIMRISGLVITGAGIRVGATKLNLVVRGVTVGQVVTDERGEYEFLARFTMPKGRQVYAYVETADGDVSSRYIWIRSNQRMARR